MLTEFVGGVEFAEHQARLPAAFDQTHQGPERPVLCNVENQTTGLMILSKLSRSSAILFVGIR